MSDLFGNSESSQAFRDIKNQQNKAAEEKAILCLKLSKLVQKVPDSIKSGSIQETRAWMDTQASARKVLAKKTASRNDLQTAIVRMEQYK